MSTPPDNTVYLVSGANRGVGLALVKAILSAHPTAFVYAGTRDFDGATSLREFQKQYPERIAIVKCISADIEGNAAISREIEERHGRVDTVIANAAICESVGTVIETPLSNVEDHFRTNLYGPIVLFQATHSLLRKSANPKFIPISSQAASIDGITVRSAAVGATGYGSSKAALNWVTRKIHFENDWLTTFLISPGMVYTDMFQNLAATDKSGLFAPVVHLAAQPDNAAPAVLNIIDRSTREIHGGEFFNVDGNKADW